MTSRCPCCGQVLADNAATETIWVEEEVLALCNRAHARAEDMGAAEVELRHVAEAIEESGAAVDVLGRIGVDGQLLIAAARRMPLSGLAGSGERPRTSQALKTLLQRAEVRARTGGAQSVSMEIFLAALLIDMRDARAAAFVSGAASQRAALALSQAQRVAVGGGARLQLPYHRPVLAETVSQASQGDPGERQRYRDRERDERVRERRSDRDADHDHDRDGEMARLLGRFDAQSRLLAAMQRQIEALSAEFGISTRSHRRFFRKRRSSTALSKYLRRRSSSNGSGTRASRSRAARQAELREGGLIEADPVDAEADDEADDDTPLATRPKRFYLALDDEIVRAPSIGPRTAAKLIAVGVPRVRDLLLADGEELAAALQTRYITPQRIAAWQAQARLVCTIPWLRGTHAQMLVGAGFDTLDKVQAADRDKLCAAVAQFAGTRDGQSVLRSGPPPESSRIVRWAEFAQLAERDRASTHAYTH